MDRYGLGTATIGSIFGKAVIDWRGKWDSTWFLTLTWGDWVNSVYLGQYHGCWCSGSLRRQDISSHDIDYVEYMSPVLTCGGILSTCVKSMWSNDIKCEYMFMFPQKNLARKGLKLWVVMMPNLMSLVALQFVVTLQVVIMTICSDATDDKSWYYASSYRSSYPGYFQELHWLSMGLQEISRIVLTGMQALDFQCYQVMKCNCFI